MSEVINGVKVPFIPIVDREISVDRKPKLSGDSFESVFREELESIKFSSHASKRLESRNIHLSEPELSKLKSAVLKAEEKGSRDSLVMMNETAFIINIPNKTVVTAMALEGSNENIFTNIDSVVFAR